MFYIAKLEMHFVTQNGICMWHQYTMARVCWQHGPVCQTLYSTPCICV